MQKLVEFHEYCWKCQHFEKDETEEPCNHCLTCTTNEDSHKPVDFKEKKKA